MQSLNGLVTAVEDDQEIQNIRALMRRQPFRHKTQLEYYALPAGIKVIMHPCICSFTHLFDCLFIWLFVHVLMYVFAHLSNKHLSSKRYLQSWVALYMGSSCVASRYSTSLLCFRQHIKLWYI